MKILYLITRADLGGAQVHVVDLLKGFRNQCQLVLGVGESGFLTEAAESLQIPCHIVPDLVQPMRPFKDAWALTAIVELIRKTKPDLVHAHTSKAGVIGRLAAHWTGVPAVFTAHTWAFAEGTSWKWQKIGLPCEVLAAKCGPVIINVSEANRRLALQHGVGTESKLITIHNGIPDTCARAEPWADTIPRIVMVARFAPQKNHSLVLRAMAGLPLPFRLVFVGDGPTREAAEMEASELGLTEKVDFLGQRRDIEEILASSHIFVLPTNWEGFPLSILEAMRAGLPVVASDVGGVGEAVMDGETGFLVPAGDEAALRARLSLLVQSPELRRRLGQSGRIRYESEFAVSAMLRKTLQVYRDMVPNARQLQATAG
jgi:glycosyltransferase involved in cell wall biosynthesis